MANLDDVLMFVKVAREPLTLMEEAERVLTLGQKSPEVC